MRTILASCFLLLACSHDPPATTPVAPPPAAAAPVPAAAAPVPSDAQAMYASCHDRVELPESPGECQTDADCAPAGCSQERCVATANIGWRDTCEASPCFRILDACGCHAGACTWTIKPAFPRAP